MNKRKYKHVYEDCSYNMMNLYCEIHSKKNYLNIINNNLQEILDNTHTYIEQIVKYDCNIFDGKMKFSNNSIISDENIYMAVCCKYNIKNINIEIYLLNNLPHVMTNEDIYFDKCSIISKYNKTFDIISHQQDGLFDNHLICILNNLFDITFSRMAKNS